MKKSKIIFLTMAFAAFSFVNQSAFAQDNFMVNVENSSLTWKGYKPTGSHTGTITLASGNIEVKNNKLTGGTFVADMSTIKDADGSAKLEGHLKSEDFFEIAVFPTSKFEITKTEINAGKIQVTGNMTIKGITKQITFPATLAVSKDNVTLISETFQINRADFNVKYKSKTFFNDLKDKFVNDEFDFQVTIIATK
ncbi:MAG: YceI family protein [Lutibacter sp.]|nr:YceI family protein [Lutibacter sp.]MDP3946869.1 YceI family protein [Lutibacter sp.]